jgi:hypothetical protein
VPASEHYASGCWLSALLLLLLLRVVMLVAVTVQLAE